MSSEPNTVIRLEGEQTIRTIAATHSTLAELYADASGITLDLSAITEADLTLVQLVQSLRQTAQSDQKKICMAGTSPEILREVLARGGFLNTSEDNLFWAAP